jgi:hypothetical protein
MIFVFLVSFLVLGAYCAIKKFCCKKVSREETNNSIELAKPSGAAADEEGSQGIEGEEKQAYKGLAFESVRSLPDGGGAMTGDN